MKLLELHLTKVLPGDYEASVTGYEATFEFNSMVIQIRFPTGVRGQNIKDTVTVHPDRSVTSKVLGVGGEIV